MTSHQLGAALVVTSLLLVLALPAAGALAARKRSLGRGGWSATVVVTIVVATAAWFMIAPTQVDGVFCLDPVAAAGLLPDSTAMTDWGTPEPERLACMAQSRVVVARSVAAQLLAVGAWVWVVRTRPAKGPRKEPATGTQSQHTSM